MKLLFSVFLILIGIRSGAQDAIKMTTPSNANESFTQFIKKDKYGPGVKPSFGGIQNEELKEKMTRYTNKIALDFKKVALDNEPTDVKYLAKIIYGLDQFTAIKNNLTKEERARVCHYIIELMDIVGLKSSKGQLNLFTYGFDPSTMKVKEK